MNKINFDTDSKYVSLLNRIMNEGTDSDDRTGVGTLSEFGVSIKFDISDNGLPAFGVRKVAPRIAFEELMFMLNGKTQTKELEDKNVNIWKGNTSREFLDNRGLVRLKEGDFGRMYGAQLREFSGRIEGKGPFQFIPENNFPVFDQLGYMINEIKNNPTSRRIIATHYNPAEADQGALFPCHIMTQFNVDPKTNSLDILFWMRSSDVGFGLPFNLMYYAMFAHLVAKMTGYKARNLVYQAGDSHLYKNQIESGMISYMIDNFVSHKCVSGSLMKPKFIVNKEYDTLEGMLNLQWEDISIEDYEPYPDFKDKPKMAV